MYRWFRWYFNFLFWFHSFLQSDAGVETNFISIYHFLRKISVSVSLWRLFFFKGWKRRIVDEQYQKCRFAHWRGVQGVPVAHYTCSPFTYITLKLNVTAPFTAMYGCVSAFRYILVGLLQSGYIFTVHGLSYGNKQQGHIII